MESFSWSDTARAVFAYCLPCLPSTRHNNASERGHEQGSRRDELESLLQSAEYTDGEMDGDAVSLHSRIGQGDGRKRRAKKKKRTRQKRTIRLFGFDLFGRPVSAGDRDDAEDDERGLHRRVSRISSSTLDSDATPLESDTIDEISSQTPEEREARRGARRHSRKHKNIITTLLDTHGDTFEGFPGSGGGDGRFDDEFGAFQEAGLHMQQQEQSFMQPPHDDGEDDAEGDFDASSYVRSAPHRSDSGSGTPPSRSSASSSRRLPHRVPLPLSSSGSSAPALPSPGFAPMPKPKRTKKIKSGKRSSATRSSTSASQPRSPTSVSPAPHVEIASPYDATDAPFEGVPMDAQGFTGARASSQYKGDPPKLVGESVHGEQELSFSPFRLNNFSSSSNNELDGSSGFQSAGFTRSNGDFPSASLGGRKNSPNLGNQGSFLARTGKDL